MLITKSEFARQVGVTPQAVYRAIKTGRITAIDGKLDEQAATLQWELNRQRMPPIRPAVAPVASSESPDVDLDSDAIWITMIWNPTALPDLVHSWLIQSTGHASPPLLNALVNLFTHFAGNVNLIRNPEAD